MMPWLLCCKGRGREAAHLAIDRRNTVYHGHGLPRRRRGRSQIESQGRQVPSHYRSIQQHRKSFAILANLVFILPDTKDIEHQLFGLDSEALFICPDDF